MVHSSGVDFGGDLCYNNSINMILIKDFMCHIIIDREGSEAKHSLEWAQLVKHGIVDWEGSEAKHS